MSPKNPFFVLGLRADATPGEIEREGRKLVGLLELGSAKTYTCALGTFERDATMVREAIAALRDPATRERVSFLARLLEGADEDTPAPEFDAPLPDAFLVGGYRGL